MQEAQSVWRDFVTSKGIACIDGWLEGICGEVLGVKQLKIGNKEKNGADKRSCLCENVGVRQRLPCL